MKPVHPLRMHRLSQGWSLDDVARQLAVLGYEFLGTRGFGVDGTMVGRWERGERRPRHPYPRLLCLLYGANAVELGLASSPDELPYGTLDEVERRRLLRLIVGAVAAPALANAGGKAGAASAGPEAERLIHALRKPSGADEAVVATVQESIAAGRRLDDVSGSRVAARAALAQREIVQTLLGGGPSPAVARGLTAAGGELSQFLAWLAHDMNDNLTSLRYLDEALAIAHETGADNLAMYVLGHRSIVELTEGRPQQALGFVQAARSWAEAKGSAATRSWLAGYEAFALAKLGDRNGAERALDRARTAFAGSKPEDEPPWMYYYDEALLDFRDGSVYVSLGLAEPARRAIQQAIATADASMVRDQAWYLADLGLTYVLEAEVDEACRIAGQALAIATRTRCDSAVVRVRELRAQLKPWETEAAVCDLDDQLAATTAWCQLATV